MSGYGRYIFSDGSEFRGGFLKGLPRHGFSLPAHNGVRREAYYLERVPNTPLWAMRDEDRLHESMRDALLPPYAWAKADCMALVN